MPRRRHNSEGCCGDEDVGEERPQQRNAANARERARMRVLARAFCRLKTTLPWVPADTKLSKLDTLRLATSYIAHLRAVLNHHQPPAQYTPPTIHPLNLTWPFSFQQNSSSNGIGVGGGSAVAENHQCHQSNAQHCQISQNNFSTYSDSLLQIG